MQSADATDHLLVDFERVVSYDNAVSDDNRAEELFARKVTAADLPEPSPSGTDEEEAEGTAEASASGSSTASPTPSKPASPTGSPTGSGSVSPSASSTETPADLQPRLLDDLGDEAFVDDVLASSGSTAKQRTVTVAFRTSNVIVTIQYDEQPATVGAVPDSKEMQDKARKLASQLADSLT